MSNHNVPKGGRPPIHMQEYVGVMAETVKRRQILFKGLIQRVWPTVTSQEALHFTRGDPTAPSGVPVWMQRYELTDLATGKLFFFTMGRHGDDIWLQVDENGAIVHYVDVGPDLL